MTAPPPGDPPGWLRASDRPLSAVYPAALVDLDGVVYLGDQPVPGASAAVGELRRAGVRVVFVTNNAAHRPRDVAHRLTAMGIAAAPSDIAGSAAAVAQVLSETLPPGAPVFVLGGDGLREALADRGFRLVDSAADRPLAVAQGYTPTIGYRDLAEAVLAVRAGAVWVAANLDATLPSPRGQLPGNGAFVAAVAVATGRHPRVAGKPAGPLHEEARRLAGVARPLVVGDRLDTDIEGATRAGWDSLLVLTGVTDAPTLLRAPAQHRPTYLALDLGGVLQRQPQVSVRGPAASCRGSTANVVAGRLRLTTSAHGGDRVDALRAACALVWSLADRGRAVDDLKAVEEWQVNEAGLQR